MPQSRRNVRNVAQGRTPRRRRVDAPAEVPTFQQDRGAPGLPKRATMPEDGAPEDAMEEAVRRMIEAAYT